MSATRPELSGRPGRCFRFRCWSGDLRQIPFDAILHWSGKAHMVQQLEGFHCWNHSISEEMEREYISQFEQLSLSRLIMRGQRTRRFVGQFGGNVYTSHGATRTRAALTPKLKTIRAEIAKAAGLSPESLPAMTIQYY